MSQGNFRTLELAIEFYKGAEKLEVPKHLNDQLLRAASSVAMNLAEGNAKFSYKDKSRIYQIAYGSLRECQVILRLAEVSSPKIDSVSNSDQPGVLLPLTNILSTPGTF